MIDYSKYATASAEPEASSMIETFRAIGYSIQAAIADIVDNSISADAKNIWVDFDWKGADTWISIKDDGTGMNNEDLIQALRPGSRNPKDERSKKDLGRFGLGLKTASFSQCRVLSVISKTGGEREICWTWDLDYVNQERKWELISFTPRQFENSFQRKQSGTIVVWNNLDRLVKNLNEDDQSAFAKFLQIMEQVKRHLAMVFHRFIENNKIKIFFQKRETSAWDPFMANDAATQKFPEEPVLHKSVRMRGFVLPHKSKLTEQEFREGEGPGGWNEQQGFYIYRNERLLVAGEWLGMYRKEEHYKLARIKVDLPNNMDAEWQIDIKKSVARPPLELRDQMKAYAGKIRSHAVEVYRHKGKVLQRKYGSVDFHCFWLEKLRHGKRFYEINREHPLIQNFINSGSVRKVDLHQLLRFIEETVPVPLITIKESEQPELQGQPFEESDHQPVILAMKKMYSNLIENGKGSEQAKSIILNIEPFNLFPEFVEHLK
ncbi:ATP-binding protein [Flavitalea antarctica]